MVLTDDQLNDLAEWVRRRSALHRYVEGWGVVRGLGVRCDPANPGRVVVSPGYARSCCGDDIVVCEDLGLDACACNGSPGPCCDDTKPSGGAKKPEPRERAVDLYLQYTETPEEPVKVVASCDCGGHDGVQYERLAEGGTLACAPVADPATDPATLVAQEWERGYASCSAVVTDYLREVSAQAKEADRLAWILGWIDRSANDALCCLRGRLGRREGLGGAEAVGTLLDIVCALRNRYLETAYGECRAMPGVLLARIWLVPDKDGRCTVECIDAHPPFRRVITPSGWPDRPGFINVAGLIWQRRAIACERVRKLGLHVTWTQYTVPRGARELAAELDRDSPFVRCDAAAFEVPLYRDPCGHWAGRDLDGRVLRLLPTSGKGATDQGASDQGAEAPRPARRRTARPAGAGQ